jgi:HK97 family phage portal protein
LAGWFSRFFGVTPRQRRSATLDEVILNTVDATTYVTPLRALQCATVYACARVLREGVAQQPCITYRRLARGKVRAPEYPLYRILHDQPNQNQDAFEFWEGATQDTVLRGNHYSRKVWVGNELRELIPFQVDSVTPKRNERGVRSYEIQGGYKPDILTAREVFHIRDMSIDGGVSGCSRIALNRETIRHSISAQQHGERLFTNAARPGGILIVPENTSEEDMDLIKKEWNEKFGSGNLYSTAIFPAGTSWSSLGMTGVDAQHLENMKFGQTEICGIMGVPLHKIGNLDHATYSNIEEQGLDWVTGSIVPLDRRIESAINTQLIPLNDQPKYFTEFLVDVLLRGNMSARMAAFSTGIAARIFNPNECREMINMNPYDGGDEYINPAISTPAGKGADNAPKA